LLILGVPVVRPATGPNRAVEDELEPDKTEAAGNSSIFTAEHEEIILAVTEPARAVTELPIEELMLSHAWIEFVPLREEGKEFRDVRLLAELDDTPAQLATLRDRCLGTLDIKSGRLTSRCAPRPRATG
jgi:hypothetical protein